MKKVSTLVAVLVIGMGIGWLIGTKQALYPNLEQTSSLSSNTSALSDSPTRQDSKPNSTQSETEVSIAPKDTVYPEHYPHREQLAKIPRQFLRPWLTPPFQKNSMLVEEIPLIRFGLNNEEADKFTKSANAIIHDFCVAEAQAAKLKTVDGETYIYVPPLTSESIKLREKILELSKSAFSSFPDDRYLFVFESLMCSDMLSDQAQTKKMISFVESPNAPTVFEITGHDHPGNGLEPPSYNSGDGEVERAKARYKLIFEKLSKK